MIREELEVAVSQSTGISECLFILRKSSSGHSRARIVELIDMWDIDTRHFRNDSITRKVSRINFDDIMSGNISVPRSLHQHEKVKVKQILGDVCLLCGLGPQWNGKPITLQIDHINGDRYDHRKENLRILCPNCHTQTDTFSSRNIQKVEQRKCQTCLRPISRYSHKCRHCIFDRACREKIQWPDVDELSLRVATTPLTQIAKELGVSDNAIRKRCKKLGITLVDHRKKK